MPPVPVPPNGILRMLQTSGWIEKRMLSKRVQHLIERLMRRLVCHLAFEFGGQIKPFSM